MWSWKLYSETFLLGSCIQWNNTGVVYDTAGLKDNLPECLGFKYILMYSCMLVYLYLSDGTTTALVVNLII